jgi:hypothetical protein
MLKSFRDNLVYRYIWACSLSPWARHKARFFGPAQARHVPLLRGPGPARPDVQGRAWPTPWHGTARELVEGPLMARCLPWPAKGVKAHHYFPPKPYPTPFPPFAPHSVSPEAAAPTVATRGV